jgi:UDP-N-acetylglucosamine 2-epimerase (non-hydrolysing)
MVCERIDPLKPFTVALVAGKRPNFMKIASIVRALNARKTNAAAAGIDLRVSIVHTGQHYDENMSEVFFREFAIPKPDHHLEVGTGVPTRSRRSGS